MIQNRRFDFLRLNSNIPLRNCGRTVLQKPLHQSNVITIRFVNLRCVPFAEAVRSDSFITKIIADKGKLFLNGSLCDGEDQIPCANAAAEAVVFNVLFHHRQQAC